MAKSIQVGFIDRVGFLICLKSGLMEQAWTWMQSGKARSVSDGPGMGPSVPKACLEAVLEDPAARQLLRMKRRL